MFFSAGSAQVPSFMIWCGFSFPEKINHPCQSGFSRYGNLRDLSDLIEIKCNFFKNYHNLKFEGKGYLTFPLLAKLCALHQVINSYKIKSINPLPDLSGLPDLIIKCVSRKTRLFEILLCPKLNSVAVLHLGPGLNLWHWCTDYSVKRVSPNFWIWIKKLGLKILSNQ